MPKQQYSASKKNNAKNFSNLLIVKLINKLAVFLISIYMNQFYHFVSSNFVVKIKNNMKVCIIGSGLSSLTLAKALVNENIYVDIFATNKRK